MDGGAWRATVHGLAESQTQLKQLSTHAKHVIRKVAQCQAERFITGPSEVRGSFLGGEMSRTLPWALLAP